jgi:hypothetical protein
MIVDILEDAREREVKNGKINTRDMRDSIPNIE